MSANTKESMKELLDNTMYDTIMIYDGVDRLNGHFEDLLERLDKDSTEYSRLYDIYQNFPTYNELDSIKDILNDIEEGEK
jgi:predicted nuclease with TOPRIM domain